MKSKTLIIISVYNEEKNIKKVITDINKLGYQILCIDDGSYDNSLNIIKQYADFYAFHNINCGVGAVFQTALEICRKFNNIEKIIFIDGDNQHLAKDIINIEKKLDNYDVVIGSRFKNKDNKIPFIRYILNFIANIISFFLSGIYISDSQSGMRGLNKKALKLINIDYIDYSFCFELMMKIKFLKLTFVEIPISIRYFDYYNGQNIFHGINTCIKLIIKSIFK